MELVEQVRVFSLSMRSMHGPYPFRAEKLGIAETSHLGMDIKRSSLTATSFKNNEDGFDGLMFHELAHEWFGNMVTASDWRDMWLH